MDYSVPIYTVPPKVTKMRTSNRSSAAARVRPSDVAADTKRRFIPLIRNYYADQYPPYSVMYSRPIEQLPVDRRVPSTRPPVFRVEIGDPVSSAIHYGALETESSRDGTRVRVPFISAANEKRPGGDWETGCSGYEEKLCRRSNLSATLASTYPGFPEGTRYPMPGSGGFLSDSVVVCRGPHDNYEQLESWYDLPVISVSPTRWPKLRDNGTMYSFDTERNLMRDKIRGALHICLANGYDRIVIGDFGLGNGYRNPPQELAELWRDVILFDPDLRGQFTWVIFVFDDHHQSTMRLIREEMARKEQKSRDRKTGASSGSRSRSSRNSLAVEPPGGVDGVYGALPTDLAIFAQVFDKAEIDRTLSRPDPRYALQMITT